MKAKHSKEPKKKAADVEKPAEKKIEAPEKKE
jgi:hypothetical protein